MKYTHGGNAFEYGNNIIDFSVNTNPLGTPDSVKRAVSEAIKKIDSYPDYDCTELRKAISVREGVPEEYIICGNGAAELIYSTMYAMRPKTALVYPPTFSEYAAAVKAGGGRLVPDDDAEITFVCNPNNPTGTLVTKSEIKERLEKNKGTLFVDECFMDFIQKPDKYSCVDLIAGNKKLIVLKSFTKMYAIAGLRLGYLMTSDTGLIEKINNGRQPWCVSSVAQAAGIAACEDINTPVFMRDYIRSAKASIEKEFDRLGIEYMRSATNFMVFREKPGLKERLLKHGILIRDCSDFDGIPEGFYRIAVRSGGDNRQLIKALESEI